MEGLEISVANIKSVTKDNETFRLDSEYFKKEYLINDKLIQKNGFKKLSDVTTKIDVGFVGSMVAHYRENGVTLLQTKNIDAFFINNNDTVKITEEFHYSLAKSQVQFEDILIARSGSFGKASIYLEKNIVNSSDIIIVKTKNINPYFLTAYLNCRYGVDQMIRFASGGLQGHVNLTILENLEIPMMSDLFQKLTQKVIAQAHKKQSDSKTLYIKAEKLLLEELGLKNWHPSAENTNTKSFKESFSSTGRLDAEYYQPKYELLLTHLKQFDTKKMGLIVKIQKSIEPGSEAYQDKGIPFIRVSNLSEFGITDTEIHLNKEEYQSFTPKPKKDTILLTKDGSVGVAYKVENDLDVVTSGALLHLTVADDEFLPDYLTLVLNSIVVKLQAERDAGGSIIQHWKPSEIEQIVIPKLPISKQHLLAEKIQKSFKLKHQSEHLLEVAKRAVEMAIEQDEQAATQYIQQNTEEV